MKKFALVLTTIAIASVGIADIQSPPKGKNGPIRKLGRAVSNIFYGVAELPSSWSRAVHDENSSTAAGYGVVNGSVRSVTRFGYGVYELVTFPWPSHKKGYLAPLPKQDIYPDRGYSEFPPELGFTSGSNYNRSQKF